MFFKKIPMFKSYKIITHVIVFREILDVKVIDYKKSLDNQKKNRKKQLSKCLNLYRTEKKLHNVILKCN